jgi:hypothetical protein
MLRPCFYDPELGDFRVGLYSVYPHLILTYLDSPPQPIWQPFTKGQQPVIGNQSLITKRRAGDLPRIVLDAFDTGDLDLENDYLNVLVISGKGWEIWKVKAKYVLRNDIQVLVPLATLDTTIPLPTLNASLFDASQPNIVDLFVNLQAGAPKISTTVGYLRDAAVLPFTITLALTAQDSHGVLAAISEGRMFFDSSSPPYKDGEIPEVYNINGFGVTIAPSIHIRASDTPSSTGFAVDGFYTRPVALNGQILAPRLSHPTLSRTYSYRNAMARFYKSGTVEVIGWSNEKTITVNLFTGVWQLPSDYAGSTSPQGLLLSHVGTLIDRFVHPNFAPTLSVFHMHGGSVVGSGVLVPAVAHHLYGGYAIPGDLPIRLPFWFKLADEIWAFGNTNPLTVDGTYFTYFFQPTDPHPCGHTLRFGFLPKETINLVRDPDLYGSVYLPFYKTPFAATDIPAVYEKEIAFVDGQEYDVIQRMAVEGIVETPEEGVALRGGALRPIYVTRYLKPAREVYEPHTITADILLGEIRLGLSGFYIAPVSPPQVVATRHYTPQAREGNFNLTIGIRMRIMRSDIPFVFPEQAYRIIEVSDLTQLASELVGKTMYLRDEMVGKDLAGMRYFATDGGQGYEILKVLVWQPMWFSHSFTTDPNYGDTLMQFGWKITTIASPPRVEYIVSGFQVCSIWFQNLLKRLRGTELKDVEKQLLRDCVCSLDGFFGAIRVTFHYDKQAGLIYMREWRLGVPFGDPVPLTTFNLQPYHEIRALKDFWSWSLYVDIIDTRTQRIIKRIKIVPTVRSWIVGEVNPNQPIAFTQRKSFANPLVSVNPSSPYTVDRNLNFNQVIERNPHALVSPNLTNTNEQVYRQGNYPLRFYPLQASVTSLSGIPTQYQTAAQKFYGSQVPVVPIQFGNLNAQPIYVASIPIVLEIRAKRDVPYEIIAKWGVGVAIFAAGTQWANLLPYGLADLGNLLHWTVIEFWEDQP